MANQIRTARTYATYATAESALRRAAGSISLTDLRYIIAATPEGRFAPVVLAHQTHLPQHEAIAFGYRGITVLG